MNRILDAIDKYKFGILAALSSYVLIFMYLKMGAYERYYPFEPFHDGSYIELTEQEIALTQNDIQVPQDYDMGPIENQVRDVNQKEQQNEDHLRGMTPEQVQQSVYDLEKQMYEEAGGAEERERIKEQMEARKEQEQNKENQQNEDNVAQNPGSDRNVMVDFDLKNRTAYQNNRWYVRNPGYTCGYGSRGTIIVDIKVNQNGNVVSASINSARSSGNSCMMEQALKYAKMSRFNYSGSAPSVQSGWISYKFVSQ